MRTSLGSAVIALCCVHRVCIRGLDERRVTRARDPNHRRARGSRHPRRLGHRHHGQPGSGWGSTCAWSAPAISLYEATIEKSLVSRVLIPQAQPGCRVTVYVDPQHPGRVALALRDGTPRQGPGRPVGPTSGNPNRRSHLLSSRLRRRQEVLQDPDFASAV